MTEQGKLDEQSLWIRWTTDRDPDAGDLLIKNISHSFHIMFNVLQLVYPKMLLEMI